MTEIEILHQRFCDYSLAFKGNTQRTIQWFREIFRYFFTYAKISTPKEMTTDMIESWIFEGKIKKNWSEKTIKNRLQALRAFIAWLIQKKFLEDDPIKNIPYPKLPKRIPEHLKYSDAMTLLEWAKNYPYDYAFERSRALAIIAMFMFTGVRAKELRSLKISDVDLENRSLFVQYGKGKKDRFVPMSWKLIEILHAYLKDRRRLKKTCPYFFTAMREDQQMGQDVIKRLVKKLRKKSGIYFYPHLLRHTFAVLMLEGGVNLYSLSKMMGHSDIKTTTIYLAATTSHLQEEMRKHPLNDFC